MKALAWGRVLRLSLAPSALADVAAGALIGGRGEFPPMRELWPLLAASFCVYHGGMALNDWSDREHDARTRPERPIPVGDLSARRVGAVGALLLCAGVGCAALVSLDAALWYLGLAALVLTYDLGPRGAWSGPLLLALCRAANLGAGLLFASSLAPGTGAELLPAVAVPPLLYGAYVLCASRIARMEDAVHGPGGAPGARAAAWCVAALLLAAAFVDARRPSALQFDPVALAVAAAGAWALARAAWSTRVWNAAQCGRFTGLALRRLLVFTAACALAHRGPQHDGWLVAAAILAGFPLAGALRRVFPPT